MQVERTIVPRPPPAERFLPEACFDRRKSWGVKFRPKWAICFQPKWSKHRRGARRGGLGGGVHPQASPFGGREGVSASKSMTSGAKAGDAGRGELANPRPPPPERVGIRSRLLWEERARGCRGQLAPQFPLEGAGGRTGGGSRGRRNAPRPPPLGDGRGEWFSKGGE